MEITFRKYQGTGNDFIIIDNRQQKQKFNAKQISYCCNRHLGIGADGLMLIEQDNAVNFKMKYYNADGKESTLCGNGGRCIVQCVHDLNPIQTQYKFNAIDGLHTAIIKNNHEVCISMNDVNTYSKKKTDYIINTGSPHYVSFKKNTDTIDLIPYAKKIRYAPDFIKQNGINVNIVETLEKNKIKVRTYERGVEDETLSCGTGVTAAALIWCIENNMPSNNYNISVQTRGGNLKVLFKKQDKHFLNIQLQGKAFFVFEGKISL